MNKIRSKIHAIIIDCLLVGAIFAGMYIKYFNQFENAKIVGDWKRIPLWYPHEIVDFGDMMGVRLSNWSSWEHPNDDAITRYSDDAVDEERAALQQLNDILEFSVGDNVVCGVRTVRASRYGRYFGKRYFVFATNQVEIAYFREKDEFLRECGLYGVDGEKLMPFDGCWKKYWKSHETCNPIKILIADIKTGFVWYELLVLVVFCYVLIRQLRRQFRQHIFAFIRDKRIVPTILNEVPKRNLDK